MTWKTVVNADVGTADLYGGNDLDLFFNNLNSSGQPFTYLVYKDGSNFVAKRDSWDLDSSNSDALTVLQYAVDNAATRRGLVLIKGEKGKWYNLTGSLSLVNKNVTLVGLYNPGSISTAAVENSTDDYGGVVFKKNFATTAPLIDMQNTVWTKHQIANISVVGNSTASDYGIRIADGREKQPIMENIWVTGFDTGVEMTKTWYSDVYNLNIFGNTTTGLVLKGASGSNVNTVSFFGGRVSANPLNVDLQLVCNDVKFWGTILETVDKAVKTNLNSNNCCFYGCSFETTDGPITIDESGNNNTYSNCRFDSTTNYTAINCTSTAKNTNIINNFFQANSAGLITTILLDSGSLNTNLISNTKSTNTVGTVTLTDNSGGSYTALANSSLGWDNFIIKPLINNDYAQDKVISAPADPAAGFIRRYPKVIDSNNDGWFIKRKIAGTVVEVEL